MRCPTSVLWMTRRSLVARLLFLDTPASSRFSYIKLAHTKPQGRLVGAIKENVTINISPTWRTLLDFSTCFTYITFNR
ncbi:hypothetical protein F5B19DRAFT_460575 [Rostrohypoxylon terebratum]|nr:hypothetical protein F5B19DRAFT_460575 [Rostrohypoxylon terebratum]